MPKKKLTAKIRKQIKDKKGKVRLKDFSGEALTYLKKYRSLQKARKAKSGSVLNIGETKIPKNSEMYRTIEEAAKIKNQTVKQFVKENEKAILNFAKNGSITITRETDYLIKDIQALPKGKKIFINKKEVTKTEAIYAVQQLQMTSSNYSNIVVMLFEVTFDLKGNMYLSIPMPKDYEDLLDDLDELGDDSEAELLKDEEWSNFLDEYDSINYVKS